MALGAELFRGQEVVQTAPVLLHLAVALGAFDLFHVHVFCVEQRLVDPLGFSFRMALITVFLTYDDLPLMPIGDLRRPMEDEADEKLVLSGTDR